MTLAVSVLCKRVRGKAKAKEKVKEKEHGEMEY